MALILSVDSRAAVNQNDRLEMELVASLNDGTTATYSFNVSYKKHAVSSYKTNWTAPPSAVTNTLVNMSENEFTMAFTEYGRLLGVKMDHQESTTFDPSAPANVIVTRQIAWSSDVANLGGNVHCFPCVVVGQTPKAVSLTTIQFNNFKLVAKYLYRIGDIPTGGAQNAWNAIQVLVNGLAGQPNELLSQTEISTLTVRLNTHIGLNQMVRADQGAVQRAVNVGNRPNPNPNRPPFRGNG